MSFSALDLFISTCAMFSDFGECEMTMLVAESCREPF